MDDDVHCLKLVILQYLVGAIIYSSLFCVMIGQGSLVGGGDPRHMNEARGSQGGLEEGEGGEEEDLEGLGLIKEEPGEEGLGGEVVEDAAYDPGEVSRR